MIERLGDTVHDPHHTRGGDEKHAFFGLTSKPAVTVCQWFDLKTTTTISWFVLKTIATVSWFGPQNQGQRFGDLGLKITVMVSWFVPQNKVREGLSFCASKLMSE
jgi:hypothetical protein